MAGLYMDTGLQRDFRSVSLFNSRPTRAHSLVREEAYACCQTCIFACIHSVGAYIPADTSQCQRRTAIVRWRTATSLVTHKASYSPSDVCEALAFYFE